MKDRLNNILFLAVTLFLSACSVSDKLDQNLSEMHEMNKNMAEMNKNMATGINQFNDVGQSVKALSDASIEFLKKSDPQKFYDKMDQFASTFNTAMASLTDQSGDIQTLIKQATIASDKFIEYSKVLKAEDLQTMMESMKSVSEGMITFNKFMAENSNSIPALANQMKSSSEMLIAFGSGLGFVSDKDSKMMLASLQATSMGMDVAASAKPLATKTTELSKNFLKNSKNNSIAKLANFTDKMLPALQDITSFRTDMEALKKSLTDTNPDQNNMWTQMFKKLNDRECELYRVVVAFSQESPSMGLSLTDATRKKNILNDYKNRCPEQYKADGYK